MYSFLFQNEGEYVWFRASFPVFPVHFYIGICEATFWHVNIVAGATTNLTTKPNIRWLFVCIVVHNRILWNSRHRWSLQNSV